MMVMMMMLLLMMMMMRRRRMMAMKMLTSTSHWRRVCTAWRRCVEPDRPRCGVFQRLMLAIEMSVVMIKMTMLMLVLMIQR